MGAASNELWAISGYSGLAFWATWLSRYGVCRGYVGYLFRGLHGVIYRVLSMAHAEAGAGGEFATG